MKLFAIELLSMTLVIVLASQLQLVISKQDIGQLKHLLKWHLDKNFFPLLVPLPHTLLSEAIQLILLFFCAFTMSKLLKLYYGEALMDRLKPLSEKTDQ